MAGWSTIFILHGNGKLVWFLLVGWHLSGCCGMDYCLLKGVGSRRGELLNEKLPLNRAVLWQGLQILAS